MPRRKRAPRSRAERVACPHCRRLVATFVPKGGDGSALYLRSHLCLNKQRASWVEAPGREVHRPPGA